MVPRSTVGWGEKRRANILNGLEKYLELCIISFFLSTCLPVSFFQPSSSFSFLLFFLFFFPSVRTLRTMDGCVPGVIRLELQVTRDGIPQLVSAVFPTDWHDTAVRPTLGRICLFSLMEMHVVVTACFLRPHGQDFGEVS